MTLQEYIAREKKFRTAFQLSGAHKLVVDQANMFKGLANPLTHDPIYKYITQQAQLRKHFESLLKLDAFTSLHALSNEASKTIGPTSLVYRTFDLNTETDTPDAASEVVVFESKRVKQIITDIYKDESTLLRIHPRQFEEVIAELLAAQGFKVELTKQTRDNGYDIIALTNIPGHAPIKFLVECKRFTKDKVGVEIIRSFKEVISTENANRGIIVTTSYFTKDAIKKKTPYLLDYRDKDDVMEWVLNYQNS